MRYWLDMERPAYQVTGEVDRYAFNLQAGENSFHTGVTKGYEAAIDVVKQERRTYWKNKLFGKLKKPIKYTDDKDLLKYATSKEDKQIIANLIQGLNKLRKDDFLTVFSQYENQQNVAVNIKQFIDKTTVKGKNIIFYDPHLLIFKDIKTLNNPHLIKIMRMANSNIKGADQLHDIIFLMKTLDSRQFAIYEGKLAKAIQKEKRIDKICDTLYRELNDLITKSANV